jgi:PAS domain S-box-containing protein
MTDATGSSPSAPKTPLRVLFEGTSDGVLIVTTDGVIVDVNAAYCAMSGDTPGALIGTSVTRLDASSASRPALVEGLAALLAEGGRVRLEARHRRSDGSTFDVELTALVFDPERGHLAVFARDLTSGRDAAARLALQAKVLERVSDAVIAVDSAFRITYWNRGAESTYGWTAQEVLGRSSREVLRTQLTEPEVLRLLETLATTGGATQEVVQHRRDGAPVQVEAKLVAERDEAGQLCGFVVANRVIGERRRAELALQESEERYRSLFSNMSEGFALHEVITDDEGRPCDYRFLEVNPAFERLTGLRRAELTGRRVLEVLPGTERHWIDRFGQVALTGLPSHLEAFSGALDRWYEAFAYCPAPRQFAVVFSDVTARKQSEEALRRSREDLDRAQAVGSIGSWRLDVGRNVLSWSDQNYRIFGVPQGTPLTYEVFLDLAHPDDREYVDSRWKAALRGEPYDIEHRIVAEGKVKWVREKAYLELDAQNRLQGGFGITQDITDRKAMENELREANVRLAEADRHKSEFLAVLSHELRNPLAPITNSLYVLDHARPGGEQELRAKEVIGRQVAQLSGLVDDLLDLTRISRGKIHLQTERLELYELVSRAVEDSRSIFEAAEVSLVLAKAPVEGRVLVVADRTRVVQVVGNLLHNSAKFTGRGGHTWVSVGVEGREAVVRVADDGVGVQDENLARVFEPFMQVEQTLARSQGGLGLGLALVKGLVELHGGSVSVRSGGPGSGAEFLVRLPRAAEEVTGPAARGGDLASARRRVLIIEDNADAGESLREVLELCHHEVFLAADGPTGVRLAREHRPDVVLCDIGLPEMDGFEVARALRADAQLKETFLVALSGYALPEDLLRATQAGFDRHLAKPPDLAELERVLAQAPTR